METAGDLPDVDVSDTPEVENISEREEERIGDDGGSGQALFLEDEHNPEEDQSNDEVVLYKDGDESVTTKEKAGNNWFSKFAGSRDLMEQPFKGKPLVLKATMYLIEIYSFINRKYLDDTSNKGAGESGSPLTGDIEGYFIPHIGEMVTMRYEITGILGKGAYSYVLRCWDAELSKPVAIKIFRKRPEITEAGVREYEILSVVSGIKSRKNKDDSEVKATDRLLPYTPKLYDGFFWNGYYCIVMELLGKSILDIYESTHGLPLDAIRFVLQPILETLVIFKSPGVGIVHCDIKPENIMLTKGKKQPIKLMDFSSSCYVGGKGLEYAQTRPYRAPEIAFREPSYGCEVDMFSLGAVLAELVLGVPLFQTESKEDHALELIRTLGMPSNKMMLNSRTDVFVKGAIDDKGEEEDFKYQLNEYGVVESKDIIGHISEINYEKINKKYHSRLRARGKRACESEMMFLISSREGDKGVLTDEKRSQAYNFINLVLNMLIVDPVQRITPARALTHPFMTQ